jgi:type II secretion system (T2SS) protein E
VIEPFVQVLAEKGILPVDKSLKILSDKSRFAYLPMNLYDIDIDLSRTFPAETCQRWCVLPFDRMSKSILVATANPFNQQAGKELAAASGQRLLWYLVSPVELVKNVRKAFR